MIAILSIFFCKPISKESLDKKDFKKNFKTIPLYERDKDEKQNNLEKEAIHGNVIVDDDYKIPKNEFQNFKNISINLEIQDIEGSLSNVVVQILALEENKESLIYQSITDPTGKIQGNFFILKTISHIVLKIYLGESVAKQMIPLRSEEKWLISIKRKYFFNQNFRNGLAKFLDSDKDQIPDFLDDYPKDSKRSLRLQNYRGSPYLIAFEEDHGEGGTLDYNDVVVQVFLEEDLDSYGQIVRLRGKFKYLAKGSYNDHILYIDLPSKGIYHSRIYNPKNQIETEISHYLNSFENVPLFVRDIQYFKNQTPEFLYTTKGFCPEICNVESNNQITQSYTVEVEFIFDEPINRNTFPLHNVYLYVVNKNQKIHFGNLNNKEIPNFLVFPLEWNWPLEKETIHYAYIYFGDWIKSKGTLYEYWYLKESNSNRVFHYHSNPLAGYILQINVQQSLLWASFVIFLSGILVFLFIRGRNESY
ncbi:MAG: LruC domain-containing protein [Leptonema sp. (in: bacteria)]